jgi:NitT/TauT family transport system permease protein
MAVSATSTPAADAPSRETVWLRRVVNHILIFAALIAAWEAGSRLGWLDPLTTPRPSDIAGSIFTIYLDQKNVYWHFFVTFVEAMAGFVIGSAAGVGLAIAAGLNEPFRRYIQPYILVPQVTPRVALTPILIAWLGFGWSPKIAIAALICFFPPFVNTVTGLLSVDEDAREMFRSLGATKSQIFWKLQLPSSMPIIMAGLKIAMSLALAGAIVGEFLSANQGMAVLIHRYTYSLNMASSFAVLLSLTALGFLLFKAAEFADSRIIFWNHEDRMAAVGRRRQAAWQAGDRR